MTDAPREEPPDLEPAPCWTAVPRGAALFLGVYVLLNLLGELRRTPVDGTLWWLDLPPWGAATASHALAGLAGAALLLFALRPNLPWPVRGICLLAIFALTVAALAATVNFFRLVQSGTLRTTSRVPFALHVAACLLVILAGVCRTSPARPSLRGALVILLTFAACAVGFPLAQMSCLGRTDGRRAADAVLVVVRPIDASDPAREALLDRTETACAVVHEGYAPRLVFVAVSGDSRADGIALRDMATAHGLPRERVAVARGGLGSHDEAVALARSLQQRGVRRVIAVDEFHALPAIRLRLHRAGLDVSTVPIDEPRRKLDPDAVARDVVALWRGYISPLTERMDVPRPSNGT